MFWIFTSVVMIAAVVMLFLSFQVNLDRVVSESYSKNGWTAKSDPLNDNRLLHVYYFPDRYGAQLSAMVRDPKVGLVEKRIAVYIGCRNSEKNFGLVLKVLLKDELLKFEDKVALVREGLFAKLEGGRNFEDPNLRNLIKQCLNKNLFKDPEVIEMLSEEFGLGSF